MKRNIPIAAAIVAVIAAALYGAHSMDLVGMIVRAHGG